MARPEISIADARAVVSRNSGIADATILRERAYLGTLIPAFRQAGLRPELRLPSSFATLNRNKKTAALLSEVEDRDQSGRTTELLAKLSARWRLAANDSFTLPQSQIAEKRDIRNLRNIPQGINQYYNDIRDPFPYVFKEIFQPSPEIADLKLSREVMKVIDQSVAAATVESIAAIDQAESQREKVKKDLVIVGGGLLTSLAATVLGQYYDVTVITKDGRLVQNWRNRPIFINSSVLNEFGANLPLLSGTTTPIIGQDQLNYLDLSILLGGDTLTVNCDDGTTREYVSGLEVGKVAAVNIFAAAEEVITGQDVDLSKTKVNKDGTKELTIVDTKTGKKRKLDANIVLDLTGPGEEVNRVEDPASQTDYENSYARVRKQIAQSRERLGRLRSRIETLRSQAITPNSQAEIAALESEILTIRVMAPGIVSLSMVEDLYDFWQHDLDGAPQSWPLRDIFQENVRIAIAGGGDTARTLNELLRGKGPQGAYPVPRENLILPEVIVYGLDERERPRRRYEDSTRENSLGLAPTKVLKAFYHGGGSKKGVAALSIQSSEGYFDNVFVSTGIGKAAIDDRLPASISVTSVIDLDGYVVGLGNKYQNYYVGGSATGFTKDAFPRPIQNIIEGLGIPENTVSLWVNALLLERLLWTILAEKGPNMNKLLRLANRGTA